MLIASLQFFICVYNNLNNIFEYLKKHNALEEINVWNRVDDRRGEIFSERIWVACQFLANETREMQNKTNVK